MATRALTAMARRTSSVGKPIRQPQRSPQNWRQVLQSQDARAVWRNIFTLVQSSAVNTANPVQVTQDLFLELLVSGRLRVYKNERWQDSAIDKDIVRLLG